MTYALSEDGKSVTVIVGQGDGAVILIELPISPTAAAALARHPATLTILGAIALGIYVYNHQEQIYEFTDEVNDAIAQGIADFYGDTDTKPKPKPPANTKGTHEIDPDDFDDQLPDGPDSNNQNAKARLPDNDAQIKHIFGNRTGHIADTLENRQILVDLANDEQSYHGTNTFDNQVYARIDADGTQVWVQVRNGIIQNGGRNLVPKSTIAGVPITGI